MLSITGAKDARLAACYIDWWTLRFCVHDFTVTICFHFGLLVILCFKILTPHCVRRNPLLWWLRYGYNPNYLLQVYAYVTWVLPLKADLFSRTVLCSLNGMQTFYTNSEGRCCDQTRPQPSAVVRFCTWLDVSKPISGRDPFKQFPVNFSSLSVWTKFGGGWWVKK